MCLLTLTCNMCLGCKASCILFISKTVMQFAYQLHFVAYCMQLPPNSSSGQNCLLSSLNVDKDDLSLKLSVLLSVNQRCYSRPRLSSREVIKL